MIKIHRLGRMDYGEALNIQEQLLKKRQTGQICDTLIIVEHPPVITIGIRGKTNNILVSDEFLKENKVQKYFINRGGDVTYHGPGQIVGYPIINLQDHGKNIKEFVWNIEEVFIRLLDNEFGIKAYREDKKYTGVWVGDSKVTAIGIAVKKWVTMHGFAFNVNTELEHFKWINPCGITDKSVTSVQKLIGHELDILNMKELVIKYFCCIFGYENITEEGYDNKEA